MLPFVSPIQIAHAFARRSCTGGTHNSRVELTKKSWGMSMQVVSQCVVSCRSSIKKDVEKNSVV